MSELQSAKKWAEITVNKVRGHPLDCTGCVPSLTRDLLTDRNDVLEMVAEHFENIRGGPYGSAWAAAEIRKLKRGP